MKNLDKVKFDYESPQIQIVDIQTEGLLCGSGTEDLKELDGDWGK